MNDTESLKSKRRGFVSLVGAGPGDPGLLTLAGRDRLAAAEVVVYDRLVSGAILDHIAGKAERIFAGKSPQSKALTQDQISALLVQKGLEGKRVVRLKGGDPFVFGRGGEEALALAAAGVAFEVIPGVTSAVAAPAYAGVPVTHRGLASSFAVVTGHEDEDKPETSVDWAQLARGVDTIVVLMGGAALAGVARALIAGGRDADTPAISIQWGTTTDQRTVSATLASIAESVKAAHLGTPLLTVVGQVASLHEHIGWFGRGALFGKRVLVTRTRHQASALSELLRQESAVPVELPTIELVPVATTDQLEAVAKRLDSHDYAWCLFTSPNSVGQLFEHLDATSRDARAFAGCKLAALGSATAAALQTHGLKADLTASEFTTSGLLDSMPADMAGSRVLLPTAEGANPALAQGLRARGAEVEELRLYESAMPKSIDAEVLQMVREGKIDVATFASSSAVRNLATLLGADFVRLNDALVACIGPVTAATARDLGLRIDIEPSTHTIPALVEALTAHYQARRVSEDQGFRPPPRVRPLAIVVVRRPSDGAILAAPGSDSLEKPRFYRPLGGEIEFGELAIDAARREIREEVGAEVIDLRLLAVTENHFTFMGAQGHEMVWTYEGAFADASLYEQQVIWCDEDGARFEAHWVPLSVFADGGPALYPDGLLTLLKEKV